MSALDPLVRRLGRELGGEWEARLRGALRPDVDAARIVRILAKRRAAWAVREFWPAGQHERAPGDRDRILAWLDDERDLAPNPEIASIADAALRTRGMDDAAAAAAYTTAVERSAIASESLVQVSVGRRIREERERIGWTAEFLAAAVGITRHTLWRLESGVDLPNAKTLLRVSAALGVHVRDLLPDTYMEAFAPAALESLRRRDPQWRAAAADGFETLRNEARTAGRDLFADISSSVGEEVLLKAESENWIPDLQTLRQLTAAISESVGREVSEHEVFPTGVTVGPGVGRAPRATADRAKGRRRKGQAQGKMRPRRGL